MLNKKHIVIIAGEESGDYHAACFVKKLQAKHKNLTFSGIGGRHLANAGVHLVRDLASIGVTGITEVIRHLPVIRRAFKEIKTHLAETKPDLLILVDYPGFNLRLAKIAKKMFNIKILYYISPQIWAWKAKRINTIHKYVDHMAVILPFEKALYEAEGIAVTYVGHPLVATIAHFQELHSSKTQLGLPQDKRIIALLPGSRRNEILRHMPILRDSALQISTQFNDVHFVIPVAGTIQPEQINKYFTNTSISHTVITEKALAVMDASDYVIVASGTASLEAALLEKPMCIIYKASMLTYIAATIFIKVKYLGLCNLLQNKMIVPELLQYDCTAIEITRILTRFLKSPPPKRMLSDLHTLKKSLSSQQSDCSIDDLIIKLANISI